MTEKFEVARVYSGHGTFAPSMGERQRFNTIDEALDNFDERVKANPDRHFVLTYWQTEQSGRDLLKSWSD